MLDLVARKWSLIILWNRLNVYNWKTSHFFRHLSDAWISLVYNKYFFFVVKFIISRLIRRYWNQLSRLVSFSFQLKFHTSKLIKLIWSRVFFINIGMEVLDKWTEVLISVAYYERSRKKSERQNCSAKKHTLLIRSTYKQIEFHELWLSV